MLYLNFAPGYNHLKILAGSVSSDFSIAEEREEKEGGQSMKKWNAPEVKELALSQTAYDSLEGIVVDGVYIGLDCEEYEAYES